MVKETPYIELSVYVRKEGNQYASWCPELDVASCGDSIEEACSNLHDAVDLYLNTLADEQELANVLQERDVRIVSESEPCDRHTFVSSFRTGVPARA
jgi:predicted RNase H-like HicB family nuclease